jgi:DnaJ-domain-containing protein 1
MTNLFALLDESPRPWLDPEALKAKYHQLTARQHPDVAGATADFAEINRAYQTLADPAGRIRHLLDLEAPAAMPRAQAVPDEIAAFFAPVAESRQAVDAFLKKHAASASPLAKALLSTVQYQVQERLEQTISALQQKQDSLLAQVREADALWLTDRPAALLTLPILWQSLNYTAKWLATLRESLFRLASL